MKIAIVDYGMGNIHSILGALKHLGISEVTVTDSYEVLAKVDKLILPGVGSFAKAMKEITKRSLDVSLKTIVLEQKKPILGICLGMQIMSQSSTEDGYTEGLGFVKTKVDKFTDISLPVPHVGFNQVQLPKTATKLYKGFNDTPDYYFTHSYKMQGEDAIEVATCNYGVSFIASFEKENIAGVQFHPELSQNNGLKLIHNFLNEF